MAFRFGDPGGYPYGTTANVPVWWNGSSNTPGNFTVVSGGGRSGGNSLHYNGNQVTFISKAFDSQPTWGIAFAVRVNVFASITYTFRLYDSGTLQLDLRINGDGTLSITRAGTVLGTTAALLVVGAYNHIEWLSTINNTTGTSQLWVNGASVLNLTGQNTRNTANSSANQIVFSSNGAGTSYHQLDMCDIIVYDGQTIDPAGNSDIHSQIGDCGLLWLLPTGDGTTTQFTPSVGGNNYSNVDDATPDGDGTYVEDATVGHIDTYTLADLPGTVGSVKSIAVVSYARKTDFSSRGMKHELRTNSTNVAHTNEILLGNSYTYYMSTWGSNPTGTPANWTVADINSLEIGRQVSS